MPSRGTNLVLTAQMDYALFRMPKPVKITGRSSSITNSFISSIIPVVYPTGDEVLQALTILGMTSETFQCAYCGSAATEWDHLRPLVIGKKPTGYISEIHNLVPSCGKCNQSKGNRPWREWMLSNSALSPTVRGVKDVGSRIERLEAYEMWREPTHLDFSEIAGKELWSKHWENWKRVQSIMCESQEIANEINERLARAYRAP